MPVWSGEYQGNLIGLNRNFHAFFQNQPHNFGFGFLAHSTGLLADAGHNLTDVGALALSLVAVRLAVRPASRWIVVIIALQRYCSSARVNPANLDQSIFDFHRCVCKTDRRS